MKRVLVVTASAIAVVLLWLLSTVALYASTGMLLRLCGVQDPTGPAAVVAVIGGFVIASMAACAAITGEEKGR
jgi:hypothetical protein